MTQQERQDVGVLWTFIADTYGKNVSKPAMKIMLDAIMDLDGQKVLVALNRWVATSKLGRHPWPAEIREMVNPAVDKRSVAVEIPYKLRNAVRKHGLYWQLGIFGPDGFYWEDDKGNRHTSFKAALLSELGEVGYYVVNSRGGWESIHNSIEKMDEGIFVAQVRDQVQSALTLQEQGIDIAQIEYRPRSGRDLESTGDILKMIEQKRKTSNEEKV